MHEEAAEYILKSNDSKLIFLSTANVFDKLDTAPHYENDELASDSDYGKFKIKREQLLTNTIGKKAVIIRVPFIWSKNSPRLKKIIEDIKQGKNVHVWSNLFTNHTSDNQIAKYIKMIIENNMDGIFHVGTNEICDYKEFIKTLIQALQLPMPEFVTEQVPYKSYLAVLSRRKDIPAELQITNSDIINYLVPKLVHLL